MALLTFGPGDHPFSKFGHLALLVEDRARGTQLVYNYGTFAFGSVWLIPKFLTGKYRYWLSVQRLDRTLATYAAENRSVRSTPLQLSAAKKREMLDLLEWNAREENKYYVFDYYRDNCATRVRDIIDKASLGALHAGAQSPAALTWRQHTQRLTAGDPWVYAGLYLAMGPLIDQPITRWEEMFLPAKVEEGVAAAGLGGAAGPVMLLRADRAPPDAAPPRWAGRLAAAGTLSGGLLVILALVAARGSRVVRVGLGALVAALGVVMGSCGMLFVFLWSLTNHAVAYRNENMLQCAPWALWLVPAGYQYARGKLQGARSLLRAAALVWVTSLLGLVLKATPVGVQDNWQVMAFTVPLWSGLALAAYGIHRACATGPRTATQKAAIAV